MITKDIIRKENTCQNELTLQLFEVSEGENENDKMPLGRTHLVFYSVWIVFNVHFVFAIVSLKKL